MRLTLPTPVLVAAFCTLLALPGGAQAARIVSIGGTVTEIVYLLGEQHQLVGTDTSSLYPEAATQLPQVGYQRTLSAEGVLSLRPDKVLITPAAGPAKVLHQLAASGIELINIDAPDSAEGITQRIEQVAQALDVQGQGQQLSQDLQTRLNQLRQQQPDWSRPPRLLFVLQAGGAPMVAGQNTAPDALFQLAGAVNAAADITGFKTLTPEALLAAAPDALVVTDQALTRLGSSDALWDLPGARATPAGQAARLLQLDALLALGLGPRTPDAITQLWQQLQEWQP